MTPAPQAPEHNAPAEKAPTGPAAVTVISVAYNSINVLPEMAESLPDNVNLVIVDNGSDDGLRDWAKERGHQVVVPGKNLGFGEGCNRGAAVAETEFLFFLNPDATLSPDTINQLLSAAERYPEAPGFAPAILKSDDDVFRVRTSVLSRESYIPKRGSKPDREVPLYSMNGAAMFVRRSAFEEIGGFDPNIFLFFEDDDMTVRLTKAKGPIIYVPTATTYHLSGHSSEPSHELVKFKGHHYSKAQVYTLRKHGFSLPFLRAAGSVLRRWLSLRTWTSTSRRSEAIGRFQGLWDKS